MNWNKVTECDVENAWNDIRPNLDPDYSDCLEYRLNFQVDDKHNWMVTEDFAFEHHSIICLWSVVESEKGIDFELLDECEA